MPIAFIQSTNGYSGRDTRHLLGGCRRCKAADEPRRVPADHRVRGYRTRDNGAGGNHRGRADVGQDELQNHLNRADVMVISSFMEGVPVVLMEAMAKQLAVIATKVGGIPELIDDEKDGLLVNTGRSVSSMKNGPPDRQ